MVNNGRAKIVIVPVKEWGEYAPLITDEDAAVLARFGNERRRAAGAAWRLALRQELGDDITIGYDEVGAPFVRTGVDAAGVADAADAARKCFIGVSHSRRWAAVIIADSPCAIDIEDAGRNYSRAKEKFLSPREASLPEAGDPLFLPAVWCAKEALYKISGRAGLELVEDLRITRVDFDDMTMRGEIRSADGAWQGYEMRMFRHEECLVAYTIERA